tara:strand:+ start:161 stop:442 length:282 start_codon:yes stop_codon:yes gene_type:complete
MVTQAATVFGLLLAGVCSVFIYGHHLPPKLGNAVAAALPMLILMLVTALLVSCWLYAKAKGRSGWWVLLVPTLNIFGIAWLVLLSDLTRDEGR